MRIIALLAFCFVFIPGVTAQTYTVRPGDTLYDISRQFNLSQKQLMERNGLSQSQHIYPGQKLILGRPAAASSGLPELVGKRIRNAPVAPGRWKYIVIHHSAVDTGTVQAMERYHRDVRHMENGLAYHFVIGNGSGMGDGEVAVGNRWTGQLDGGHLASEEMNKVALGICLVGNFDDHKPSARQMASLRALTKALMARCKLGVSAVKIHRQINIVSTRCPGARFPYESFIRSLR